MGPVGHRTSAGYERVSSQDATLLCAESPEAPLQIGALCLFEAGPLLDAEGHVRIGDLRSHISDRLDAVPRFRQKLLTVPLAGGRPVWVDDTSFDIAHHVRVAALPPPGGRSELRAFMSSLLEVPLDHSRPLWEVWFVEGVSGDRVAVVPKINHVMADGMAALEFALSVLDSGPEGRARTTEPWVARPTPGGVRVVAESIAEQGFRWVEMGLQAVWGLRRPDRLAGSAAALVRAVMRTVTPAPDLPVTRPVGPRRDFAWVPLPLAPLRGVARTHSVTLNDVVLSIVGRALGLYLRADAVESGVQPRVLVPVSTHHGPGEVQNRFSMMIGSLPLLATDPLDRLRLTHDEMEACKASGQTAIGPLLFGLIDLVPPALLRLAASVVLSRQPFVNLAVTNLPGSADEAYLLGSRLEEIFPFVTVTGNIALIIGVLSHAGTLGVGITVDADVVADLDRLAEGVRLAAEELLATASDPSPALTVR